MCCVVHVPALKSLSNIAFLPTKYLCSVEHKYSHHNNFYYIVCSCTQPQDCITDSNLYVHKNEKSSPAKLHLLVLVMSTEHTNMPVCDQLANFTVCFQIGLLYSTNQWLHQIQLVYLHWASQSKTRITAAHMHKLTHTVIREIHGSSQQEHNCTLVYTHYNTRNAWVKSTRAQLYSGLHTL